MDNTLAFDDKKMERAFQEQFKNMEAVMRLNFLDGVKVGITQLIKTETEG